MAPIHSFYIATKLERALAHNAVRDELVSAGWSITYDWTAHGSVQREGEARIRAVAEAETKGVADADVVIVLLPGGRGTHAELGIAIATGAQVFVCADSDDLFQHDERTCAFYWHPNVKRIIGPPSDVAGRVRKTMLEEDAFNALIVMGMRGEPASFRVRENSQEKP